jgi:hypothetical protein
MTRNDADYDPGRRDLESPRTADLWVRKAETLIGTFDHVRDNERELDDLREAVDIVLS